MTTTTNHDHCIDVSNSLLRGELSAVETYKQAIEKFSGEEQAPMLNSIRGDHEASVERLQANVISMGGVPETDSGAWGTFATAIQGTANFLGEGSALASLEQGEQHGKRSYEDALRDEEVTPACKAMIRDDLLPRIGNHLGWIEKLSATV